MSPFVPLSQTMFCPSKICTFLFSCWPSLFFRCKWVVSWRVCSSVLGHLLLCFLQCRSLNIAFCNGVQIPNRWACFRGFYPGMNQPLPACAVGFKMHQDIMLGKYPPYKMTIFFRFFLFSLSVGWVEGFPNILDCFIFKSVTVTLDSKAGFGALLLSVRGKNE